LAFAISRRKTEVSLPAAQTASTVGLLLILYSVFAFTKSTPFPSLYALVPTIGAALLIAFATPATFVGKLLGSKAFVGLGLISYSAYLWHQPLFAFARERNLEEPGTEILLFLSASAVALAYLSWRFVEQPFRRKNVVGRKKVIVFAISVSLLFFAIGNYGQRTDGFPNRYEQYEKVLSQQFTPHLLRNACDEGWDGNGRERDFCILGATEPGTKPTIAVFGDSHSNTMNPVFDYLGKKHGRSYVQLGLGGCPPLIGVDVLKGNHDIGVCRDLFTRQYEYVKENGIKKVFLISNWVLYTMGGYDKDVKGYYLAANDETDMTRENSRQVFKKAIRNTISAYEELGVDVIVPFQIPQQEVDPRKLYVRVYQFGEEGTEAGGLRVRESSVSFEKHSRLQSFYRGVLEVLFVAGRITLINLDSLYCDNEKCLAGDSSQSYYRDYDHPNERGALLAASILEGVFADVKQGGHGELGQGSK
jgi:hypothetical protein